MERYISILLLLLLSMLCIAFLLIPGRTILFMSRLFLNNLKNSNNEKDEDLYRDLQSTPKEYQRRHKFLTAFVRLLGVAWIAFVIYVVYMWKIELS